MADCLEVGAAHVRAAILMGYAVAFFTGCSFAALLMGNATAAIAHVGIATFLTAISIINEKNNKK